MTTNRIAIEKPLIEAGMVLAEFARESAAEAIRASGDVMDGAFPNELADDWDRAVRFAAQGVGESAPYTIGRIAGQQRGTAQRDELIELATTLVRGLGAALAVSGTADDGDPCPDDWDSLEAAQEAIAAAGGAANRLHHLILEAECQQTLPVGT